MAARSATASPPAASSLAYVPDAARRQRRRRSSNWRDDVDCFVRGAPFLAAESERADAFGHGTVEHAVEIAQRAGARRLVLTHHAPTRTDDEVDAIVAAAGVEAAYDGLTIDLG